MATTGSDVAEHKIDPVMEKPWQRAKRFQKYDYFRKSAFPPMEIEPLPHERNRLSGEGMTPEQRALRKQWVKDQILHHDPRNVSEVQPYNIFRRIYRMPADLLIYKPFNAIFGRGAAECFRYSIPKIIMFIGGSYLMWYHLKYNQNDWTKVGGIVMYEAKPMMFGKEAKARPEKDKTDYFDRGFKSRTALRQYADKSSA